MDNETGECLECGDVFVGPAFRCPCCGVEACDGCLHHGMHTDADGETLDMSSMFYVTGSGQHRWVGGELCIDCGARCDDDEADDDCHANVPAGEE